MKKLCSTLVLCAIFAFSAFSQSGNWQYCELVGTAKILSNKLTVSVDYGQGGKFWSDNKRIIDSETGKPRSFESMVDAMNFLGEVGWEFVQAYTVTAGNQNVYHWLLKIPTEKNANGEAIPKTRGDLKKE